MRCFPGLIGIACGCMPIPNVTVEGLKHLFSLSSGSTKNINFVAKVPGFVVKDIKAVCFLDLADRGRYSQTDEELHQGLLLRFPQNTDLT